MLRAADFARLVNEGSGFLKSLVVQVSNDAAIATQEIRRCHISAAVNLEAAAANRIDNDGVHRPSIGRDDEVDSNPTLLAATDSGPGK